MELTAVVALKPGMEIAQDVLDNKGNVIMRADTNLDKHLIQKLQISNIACVYTKEPEDYFNTYFEKVRFSKTFKQFFETYNEYFEEFKMIMQDFLADHTKMNNDRLLEMVKDISKPFLKSKITILDMLAVLETSDKDFIYAHSMNVALICNYTGKWFKLDEEEIDTLTLCGFYYDIGKTKIPNEVLTKKGRLTQEEFEMTKTHTVLGYQILTDCDIDYRIKLSALMHHERCDGTGYPQRLKDEKINKFAKIIAILDSYEAMTSYRTYRAPLCPFTVIEIFQKDGFGKYDTGFYLTFLERMVEEYIGKQVQLSDGSVCSVVLINKQKLSKPMVKTDDNKYIDLSQEKSLSITTLI